MSATTRIAAGVLALLLLLAAIPMLLIGALTGGASAEAVCASGGGATSIANITLTAEQMANATTIAEATAAYTLPNGTRLPARAAVIAEATAYQESKLVNSAVQTDHDSEGLFQQRVSIYGAQVAIDPVQATRAFLVRLVAVPNWQTIPLTQAAQAVQRSAYPNAYAQWEPLAQTLINQLWPAAQAQAGGGQTSAPAVPAAPACPGAGGAAPAAGGTDNVVAGSPAVPAGLVMDGSAAGNAAARYALAQLGKPYVFGATGPAAYDCSGLMLASWASAGVALPRTADLQSRFGTAEAPDLSQAVTGDLLFIPGSDGTVAHPGHVGMVIGYTDDSTGRHLWLVQAPGWKNLPVEVTDTSQWRTQLVGIRHVG